ncbi:MAG: DNA polymerase III subunit alpha [Candidatus Krumholzibacteria bacterium]|nr:DNA polymerase III subunit alpha [Candidatus Krumholzibacteria bacterium]MDP6669986.1 DNA polymerase III subunit alpha [Candidatus Krumholzibacteria bacterium]MDP7020728.1 DNA polymerase III subunit alpha [Candidatus Krumholzibacteria bacterium]
MSRSFVHLHNHSDYSLLDGAIPVGKLVEAAVEQGMPAIALTDHGNLFGAINFYLAAKKAGIRPIIGMEAYSTPGSRHDRATGNGRGSRSHHLVLLARNLEGFHNLIQLSSHAYLEGFYYKPRLDRELLKRHSAGLIATTACMSGEVNRHFIDGQYEEARRVALELQEIFGEGHFFLEIQNHGLEEEEKVRESAARLSRETGIPLVATNDCHYLHREDSEAHNVLLCIGTGKTLDDENRFQMKGSELCFKSSEEMQEVFADYPEACENTLKIAELCDLEIPMGENLLPNFPLPDKYAGEDEYLAKLSLEGLQKRYGEVTEDYRERLDYELSVIRKMGFAGYFLITADFIDAARERNIAVGPGRGSAAGSLVCYSLGITELDPIFHGLLFERFLNPDRISMPDIDIDFDYERRGEVIDYVAAKYGEENVCQIITYGTMKARAVIRDVGRVLGLPYGEVDRIAKMIPEDLGMTLDRALDINPDLRALASESETHDKLIRYSQTLEGLIRHASTHAAGVLITPDPLVEHIPLFRNNREETTTQWDMVTCEQVGLLKMDFLGLRTLTVIENALKIINHGRPDDEQMQASDIPLDDKATYDLMKKGDTIGLFQIESSGMRDILQRLVPDCFEDIVAVNALFRPGPLGSGMTDDFIERKRGRKHIAYPHEDLKSVLEETHGTILYQEQVMKIAQIYAGFSPGQADELRKAMGKKKMDMIARIKLGFIEGAVKIGRDRNKAEDLFDLVEHFGGYGFNKSHSAAYAVLSVRTGYLKAHYPAAYLAACMSSEMGNTSRIVILMNECRSHGIEVVPPDVQKSWREFRVVDGRVFFGLGAVKNVGDGAIEEILRARGEEGGFRDLHHFCESLDLRKVNKKVLESLVLAGAMDTLGPNRPSILASLEDAMRSAQSRQRDLAAGQMNLLDSLSSDEQDATRPGLSELPPWERGDLLAREKEVLGFFVSGHPLDRVRRLVESLPVSDADRLSRVADGSIVRTLGLITGVSRKTDSKGRTMAFLSVEDFMGSYEVIVFSSAYQKLSEKLSEDRILAFEGKANVKEEGEVKLLLDEALDLEEALEKWPRQVHFYLGEDFQPEWLPELEEELRQHEGSRELVFHLPGQEGQDLQVRARGLSIRTGEWMGDFLEKHSERLSCRFVLAKASSAGNGHFRSRYRS